MQEGSLRLERKSSKRSGLGVPRVSWFPLGGKNKKPETRAGSVSPGGTLKALPIALIVSIIGSSAYPKSATKENKIQWSSLQKRMRGVKD